MKDDAETGFWLVVAVIAAVIFFAAVSNDPSGDGRDYYRNDPYYQQPHSCYGDYRLGDC